MNGAIRCLEFGIGALARVSTQFRQGVIKLFQIGRQIPAFRSSFVPAGTPTGYDRFSASDQLRRFISNAPEVFLRKRFMFQRMQTRRETARIAEH